ncbi:MAG: hypothetical protein AB7L84_12950 [Acidimicrobiia bacterium]
MTPHARLSCTLVLSLVLWSPTLLACVAGRTSLESAALRYAVGLAFAHLAVGLLAHLVRSYTPALEPDDAGAPADRRSTLPDDATVA